MPFIPHTERDIREMLNTIGVDSIDDLFDEIPDSLKIEDLNLPDGQSEMAVARRMRGYAARDGQPLCFAGAGAYEHHIPAAIWQITTRGEFYSAYTPYQAEASQGTLQLIYEFQTMMAKLTAMEVSNASLYDGASGLAEAVLMAVRANRKSKSRRILIPTSVNPAYRKVLHTLLDAQEIELVELPFSESGITDPASLDAFADADITAVVVPQPNFFGVLEPVAQLTDRAHSLGALVIGVINPTAMSLLEPPGHWGAEGADIVCGEGQPLGIPLSSGGPYFGILCCKKAYVRQMPGRLVGRTTDLDGRPGYALTLQAREQHIRRAKATSNICTNQGLMVTAATIYMALMGPRGLEQVAAASHSNTLLLREALSGLDGVGLRFDSPVFHEFAVELPIPAGQVIDQLAKRNILAGYDLGREYPDLGNCLLVCATETKTQADIKNFVEALGETLLESAAA